MSIAHDEDKIVESLKPSPALLVELIEPGKVDDYTQNPDIPIPVIIKTPEGISLNGLLPEGSQIFLCQNSKAYETGKNEGKSGSLVIQTEDLADTVDFIGIEERSLEVLGRIFFETAMLRIGTEQRFNASATLVYRDNREYWRDNPELRGADHLLPQTTTVDYIENANLYTGLYSTTLVKAVALAGEMGLATQLVDRLKTQYNSQMSEAFRVVTAGLKDLVTFAHPPDETGYVRIFNPRVGKYVSLSWNHINLLEFSGGKAITADDLENPKIPETERGSDVIGGSDKLKERLTRIYESRFPQEPLELVIEHTGNMVEFDGYTGWEVVLQTDDGSTTINDFLPTGVRILDRHHPTQHFYYYNSETPESRHVIIDLNYVEENSIPPTLLVVIVAHEIGHACSGSEKRWATISNSDLINLEELLEDKDNQQRRIPRDLVAKGVRFLSAQMNDEVEAWNEGKLIATACGVEEIFYEWEQTNALGSYFYQNMETVNEILTRGESVVDSDEFDIYDPYTQEYRKMTASEVRQIVVSLEFASKSKTISEVNESILPTF